MIFSRHTCDIMSLRFVCLTELLDTISFLSARTTQEWMKIWYVCFWWNLRTSCSCTNQLFPLIVWLLCFIHTSQWNIFWNFQVKEREELFVLCSMVVTGNVSCAEWLSPLPITNYLLTVFTIKYLVLCRMNTFFYKLMLLHIWYRVR